MSASNIEIMEPRRLFNGTPAISIGDIWVDEGNTGERAAQVTVSLSQRSRQTVTVNYVTQNGSAIAGADYRAVSSKLTFSPGETSKSIPLAILGDRIIESEEHFALNLQGAKNAKIADGQALVSISDDEPRIFINDVYKNEGNSGTTPFSFTVSLSHAYDLNVTVRYAIAPGSATAGSDYTSASGTLTFTPGQITQTINVQVNGDRVIEENETFFVNLSNPSSNAAIVWGAAVGTIVDDEARISIEDSWIDEASARFTFVVTLSAPSPETITVNFRTADDTAVAGADYQAAAGTITFAPGQTRATITVRALNTTVSDKYFLVHLSNATNASVLDGEAYGAWSYDPGYWWPDPWYGWY